MNFKIIYSLLILSATSNLMLFGKQTYSATPETPIMNFVSSSNTIENEETKGSPYLTEDFVAGEVIVNDKVELRGRMRYNAYKNQVEVLDSKDEDSYFALLKRSYIKVKIEDKPYNIHTYREQNGSLRTSYFVELNEGSTMLLFKPEAKLRMGRVASTSYDRNVPPTFIWANSYYILDESENGDSGNAEKIKLSKRNILSSLSNHKEAVKGYIKENRLNLHKEGDVIELLNYYNSL